MGTRNARHRKQMKAQRQREASHAGWNTPPGSPAWLTGEGVTDGTDNGGASVTEGEAGAADHGLPARGAVVQAVSGLETTCH